MPKNGKGMKKVAWLLVAMLGTGGCSTALMIPQERASNPQDPLEPLNRDIYAFNRFLDKNFLKPVAQGYNAILPGGMQRGVNNFFNNLRLVPTVLNDVLQLKFADAGRDLSRLAINTTLGVGGLYDWATPWGLNAHYEDFGQTLAHWGFEESAYLVIPFIGPSTIRDGIGTFADRSYLSVWPYIEDDRVNYTLTALDIIDDRAALLRSEGVVETAATDEYAFVRSAYLQRRAHQIRDGEVEALEEDDEDFYNDPFEDE